MNKSEIRNIMKSQRNQLSKNIRDEYNCSIREKLFEFDEYRECKIIFSYLSFGSEVDTIDIIGNALDLSKNVYIPRVEGSEMNFYRINNLQGLIRSKFGVLEPDPSLHEKYNTFNLSNKKKLMILPGLAFDSRGNRIGYGAGYYDRCLVNFDSDDFIKVALAYNFQIIEDIPSNQYDIPVDYIITPETVYKCN